VLGGLGIDIAGTIQATKQDKWMEEFKGTLPRKIKKSKLRLVGVPEQSIQNAVENYLQLKGLQYIHIPNAVYRMCAPFYKIPIQTKKEISEALKGIPDLLIFKASLDGNNNDCLLLELKRKNGKARQSQTNWHKGLNMNICDSVDDAIKTINEWMAK